MLAWLLAWIAVCGPCLKQNIANRLGLDLIITDHHSPLEQIPECFRSNRSQAACMIITPGKELAGVGVAYKLAQALFTSTNRMMEMGERWIDLVAIGTVADLAPLMNENRFLVRKGLELIQKGSREGLVQLCRVAGIDYQKNQFDKYRFWDWSAFECCRTDGDSLGSLSSPG